MNNYQEHIDHNNIRALRKQYDLRQQDVADLMGFEVIDRLSHWERARAVPGLINAIKLCVLYGVTLKELYPKLYEYIAREVGDRKDKHFREDFLSHE